MNHFSVLSGWDTTVTVRSRLICAEHSHQKNSDLKIGFKYCGQAARPQ